MNRSRTSFTIIELVIVIGIMLIGVGTAIPAYNNYNSQKQLLQGADSINDFIETAKKKTNSADFPQGCTDFNGYLITITGTTSLTLDAICDSSGSTTPVSNLNIKFPNITMSSYTADKIKFKLNSEGITFPGSVATNDDIMVKSSSLSSKACIYIHISSPGLIQKDDPVDCP